MRGGKGTQVLRPRRIDGGRHRRCVVKRWCFDRLRIGRRWRWFGGWRRRAFCGVPRRAHRGTREHIGSMLLLLFGAPMSFGFETLDQLVQVTGFGRELLKPLDGDLDPACGGVLQRSLAGDEGAQRARSEEHTSELQSRLHLVCRLPLEKKKKNQNKNFLDNKKKKKQKT